MGEIFILQQRVRPWARTLTKLVPVPEAFEFPTFDWPEKYFFLANQ